MTVRYIKDTHVSNRLDSAIRTLLTECFTKPEERFFRYRRYFIEPPRHRWYVECSSVSPEDELQTGAQPSSELRLCGHLALHERDIVVGDQQLHCGGISEVAVAPSHRQRGVAKLLLKTAHEWMARHGFDAAILFGDPEIYASSGYRAAPNPIRYVEPPGGRVVEERFGTISGTDAFMYRLIRASHWPADHAVVELQGHRF